MFFGYIPPTTWAFLLETVGKMRIYNFIVEGMILQIPKII
jgi:hypothetical protein